jgi:AcrR family transcriptional regulator
MAGRSSRPGTAGAPAPPGRRARQKAQRERRILRAAEALFARRGFAATSMEDVARRAGLAVGTLYNYFPSKTELALALLRRETEAALAAGEAVCGAPPEDAVAAVAALLDVYVDLVARHGRDRVRQLVVAFVTRAGPIGRAAFEMDLRLLGQLAGLLGRLAAAGKLAPQVEPGRAAVTLYGIYLTWLLAFAASEALPAERMREEVRRGVALAMAGIAKTPPRPRRGPWSPPRRGATRRSRS